MLDPHDPWLYELCFPGAISGETEVSCPHCNTLLTISVDDPTGSQEYRCSSCGQAFVVNFGS